MAKDRDIEIYQDYLVAKHDPEKTVTDVAIKYGMTRNGIYALVKRIEAGNINKINECLRQARYECYWKYKYEPRFVSLPRDQKQTTVVELKKIINDMVKDDFPVTKIAEYIGKDRATILHHIDK